MLMCFVDSLLYNYSLTDYIPILLSMLNGFLLKSSNLKKVVSMLNGFLLKSSNLKKVVFDYTLKLFIKSIISSI